MLTIKPASTTTTAVVGVVPQGPDQCCTPRLAIGPQVELLFVKQHDVQVKKLEERNDPESGDTVALLCLYHPASWSLRASKERSQQYRNIRSKAHLQILPS
jgi:hypothetical protein